MSGLRRQREAGVRLGFTSPNSSWGHQHGSLEDICLTLLESGAIGGVSGWILWDTHSEMEISCLKFGREYSQDQHLGKRKEGSRNGPEKVGLSHPHGDLRSWPGFSGLFYTEGARPFYS